MNRRLLVAGALVAFALPMTTLAFKRSVVSPGSGITIAWAKRDVSWMLHKKTTAEDPTLISPGLKFDDALTAIQTSFDTWHKVPCADISFSYSGETSRMDVGFDRDHLNNNANLLVFRDAGSCGDTSIVPANDSCHDTLTCADKYNCWNHDAGTYALTTTNYNINNGLLADVDIEFNATPGVHRFSGTPGTSPRCVSLIDPTEKNCVATDVQNTATHEIGHFIGIDHSSLKTATMYFSANDAETSKRVLSSDDTDVVCAIYPTWKAAPEAGGCTAGGVSLLGAVVALVLVSRRNKGNARSL